MVAGPKEIKKKLRNQYNPPRIRDNVLCFLLQRVCCVCLLLTDRVLMDGQLGLSSNKWTGNLCSLAPCERQEEEEPLMYRCWSGGGGSLCSEGTGVSNSAHVECERRGHTCTCGSQLASVWEAVFTPLSLLAFL